MERALVLRQPGQYQLQAAISALHVEAASFEETDWEQIVRLYGALGAVSGSPVVEVNRAVAVTFAFGASAGLDVLAPLLADGALDAYQPLHAAHAELLRRAGDVDAAAAAYRRAISLSGNAVQRAELSRRLGALHD